MKLEDCLKHFGTPCFDEMLYAELQQKANDLPLDKYCVNGGSIASNEDVLVEDLKLTKETPPIVTGSFHVCFTESYHGGCRDIEHEQQFSGRMEFNLDVKSGDVEFTNPTVRRVYEKEEF